MPLPAGMALRLEFGDPLLVLWILLGKNKSVIARKISPCTSF